MEYKDRLDIAAEQMNRLVKSDLVNKLRDANEATVRLLIIDEVLNVLGWDKNEYQPEQVTSKGGYTDYRLSIENQPRLIVEAKRIGTIEPFPKSIQQPQYSNSYLYNRCGPELKELLDQCSGYCAQCGVPYALATTGEVWIILLGFKYGTEWGKLKAFVFHLLEDILKRFNDFYGLVSREAVRNNGLEEKFADMTLVKPNIAIHPREKLGQSSDVGQAPNEQVIRAFFDQFMGDITVSGREKMLEQCYVENRTINEFSRDLQQILQYDAALDELDMPISEVDNSILEKELEYQYTSHDPKTILLVGNVGAGKSTFIHRFSRYEAQPRRTICTIVNVINRSVKEFERTHAEEERLAGLVLTGLSSAFRDKADPYSPEIVRGCFEVELNRFKRLSPTLFRVDPNGYAMKEEELLLDLKKDQYMHLVGYLKYIRKKRYKAWVAFDNVDRGPDSYQAFVYAFAHQLSTDTGCVTLITLRQDTFLEAKDAGFLDVRSVEWFCKRYEVACPDWVYNPVYCLSEPWFDAVHPEKPEVRERLLRQTPEPFTRRNIFCGNRRRTPLHPHRKCLKFAKRRILPIDRRSRMGITQTSLASYRCIALCVSMP